jgi:nucleotide-binding universal stress UspA family protein
MKTSFKIIGSAVSFAATTQAMAAETARLVNFFQARLVLMHVGRKDSQKEAAMQSLVDGMKIAPERIKICWAEGDPADQILKICQKEKVDLLIAGALSKENLLNHYLGSVARKIMRKATCSIWMITNPSVEYVPLKNIVVDAEGFDKIERSISLGCQLGRKEKDSWVHIVRELKMLGLALSVREQCTESEYDLMERKLVKEETEIVEKALATIPHKDVKINIKLLAGKSGFELVQFARRKSADLLIIRAPERQLSIFDRIFPHDQEYIFSDLPCNLLIIQPTKKV